MSIVNPRTKKTRLKEEIPIKKVSIIFRWLNGVKEAINVFSHTAGPDDFRAYVGGAGMRRHILLLQSVSVFVSNVLYVFCREIEIVLHTRR